VKPFYSNPANFWSFVRKDAECWEWMRFRNKFGYGRIRVSGVNFLTHRYAWILTHGVIPDDLCVLHRCDNPPCVNPSHLYLGTDADNARDRTERGRYADFKGEKHPRVKLSEREVLLIRQRLDDGESQTNLAAMFGVTQAMISCIHKRLAWRHI
jgi:hypothetical protein